MKNGVENSAVLRREVSELYTQNPICTLLKYKTHKVIIIKNICILEIHSRFELSNEKTTNYTGTRFK